MVLNKAGKDLIKSYEGLKLNAYMCPSNLPTIGYGNTFYENGTKVKLGDVITKERAEELFDFITNDFAKKTAKLIKKPLSENQFSALVSFAFNCGIENLRTSTLLRKVNANPNDATIADEFSKWVRSNGKVLKGLQNRRKAESNLYFKK